MKRTVVLLLVGLSACTTQPPRTLPPVVDGAPAEAPSSDGSDRVQAPPAVSSGGAVVALLNRADAYHRSGDISNEAATIERALRIDPNNAHLWSRLASTRLEQGQPRQAEQLALKSNALAVGDERLQVQNWRLVARARWAMDDSSGARSAEQKVRDLERRN